MLFIHPMWDNEAQRLGKQRCTPTGYALHVVAEYFGVAGLLLLLVMPVVLIGKGVAGTFKAADWWLMAVPFGVGIISEILMQSSWLLAWRKGFRYDYDKAEASWVEAGERRSYTNPDVPCDRCGHSWNRHRLVANGSPPAEFHTQCPVEGCNCRMTEPEWTAQMNARNKSAAG